jgi:hypothetical protein
MDGRQGSPSKTQGSNHPGGATFHYYINEPPADTIPVNISIYEADGSLIRTYSSTAKEEDEKLEYKKGGNTFNWDMRYPDGVDFDGMIMWWAGVGGPKAKPGEYEVRLSVGDENQSQRFEILPDPRSEASEEDLAAQFEFMKSVQDKVSEAHQTIIDIRDIKTQLNAFVERLPEGEAYSPIKDQAKVITEGLTAAEEKLYQTKNRSGQDPLNFPIQLTNKLAHLNSLAGVGDFRPTAQSYDVKEELTTLIDEQLLEARTIMDIELPKLNALIRESQIDLITSPKVKP